MKKPKKRSSGLGINRKNRRKTPPRHLRKFSTDIYDENPDDLATEKSKVLWTRVPKWLYDQFDHYCKHVTEESKSATLRQMVKYILKNVIEAQQKNQTYQDKVEKTRATIRAKRAEL